MWHRGDNGKLDRRLRRERPQPPEDFVSSLAARLGAEPARGRSLWRTTVAVAFTAMLVLALGLTGGIGYAASAAQGGATAITTFVTASSSEKPKPENPGQTKKSEQGSDENSSAQASSQDNEKVTICHVPPGNPDNPQTITISENAVDTHLEEHEGDSIGPCPEEPGPPDDEYEDKVLICHIPPGNPGNAHTIRVSENALPAHLAHGDTEGPCPGDEGDED